MWGGWKRFTIGKCEFVSLCGWGGGNVWGLGGREGGGFVCVGMRERTFGKVYCSRGDCGDGEYKGGTQVLLVK